MPTTGPDEDLSTARFVTHRFALCCDPICGGGGSEVADRGYGEPLTTGEIQSSLAIASAPGMAEDT